MLDSEEAKQKAKDWIQQNYLKVDVYYKSLNVRRVKQSPQFTVSSRSRSSLVQHYGLKMLLSEWKFLCWSWRSTQPLHGTGFGHVFWTLGNVLGDLIGSLEVFQQTKKGTGNWEARWSLGRSFLIYFINAQILTTLENGTNKATVLSICFASHKSFKLRLILHFPYFEIWFASSPYLWC